MNKRSVPIAIASCILALAGIAGYFIPTHTQAVPTRLLMENPGGRVIFTHQAHSTDSNVYGNNSCAACHHELNVASADRQAAISPEVMECSACHGTVDNPDFIVSHQERYKPGGDASCVSCHHTKIQGYSSLWNHEDHKTYAGEDCETCHHSTDLSAKSRPIKPQKCSNCHTAKPNRLAPTPIMDAAHKTCLPCHEDLFEQGTKGCATCHTQVSTSEELAKGTLDTKYTSCNSCHAPLLSSMDAFHNQCMGCHDKEQKGPGKASPCAQCHTP